MTLTYSQLRDIDMAVATTYPGLGPHSEEFQVRARPVRMSLTSARHLAGARDIVQETQLDWARLKEMLCWVWFDGKDPIQIAGVLSEYSQRLDPAFEVVRHIENTCLMSVCIQSEPCIVNPTLYIVDFRDSTPRKIPSEGKDASLPLAICYAALALAQEKAGVV